MIQIDYLLLVYTETGSPGARDAQQRACKFSTWPMKSRSRWHVAKPDGHSDQRGGTPEKTPQLPAQLENLAKRAFTIGSIQTPARTEFPNAISVRSEERLADEQRPPVQNAQFVRN